MDCLLLRAVFLAALCLLFSPSVEAQPYPLNQCNDTMRVWPPIRSEQQSNGSALVNRYRFHLDWERIAGESCHQNPPSPIVEGQDSLAR